MLKRENRKVTEIKVAVINSSKEITEMLREILLEEGFLTCEAFTYEFKEDVRLFDQYILANKPTVIIYDIAPPYRDNYFFFQKLFSRRSVQRIPFVLTTTNKNALESFVGKTSTHELVGKPFDLQEIIDAVKLAYVKKEKKKLVTF